MRPDGPTGGADGFAALTPAWLTEALRAAGALGAAAVRGRAVEPLGAEGAYASQVARLRLEYDGEAGGAPPSLVAKLPSANPEVRRFMMAAGAYAREARFYETFAAGGALRVPRCYHAAADAGDHAVLLLEDFPRARPGDQGAGCGMAQAERLVERLAAFHAGWWESPALARAEWLPRLDQGPDLEALYASAWEPFRARFGDGVPAWTLPLFQRFGARIGEIRARLALRPLTLVHGDFRVDNLLFGAPPDPELVVLDWQTAAAGRGVLDVAYLMAGSLVSHEPAEVLALLERYHGSLQACGVRGYSFERCCDDHRLALLFLLARTVIAGGRLGLDAPGARDRFQVALSRGIAAFAAFDVAALLD